jgi:hypothetical protein
MRRINMQIETRKGFDNTFVDFNRWALIAGFKLTYLLSLAGPTSAATAYKAGVPSSKLFFISKY